jgi:hypothetical protein
MIETLSFERSNTSRVECSCGKSCTLWFNPREQKYIALGWVFSARGWTCGQSGHTQRLLRDTPDPDSQYYPKLFRVGSIMSTTREVKTVETDPNHAVIGKVFHAWDGKDYLCDSWDENMGFWMTDVSDPTNRKNVSERAIGATFHFKR